MRPDQIAQKPHTRNPRPYRGTSHIRKRPPPQDQHRALGIKLLWGRREGSYERGTPVNPMPRTPGRRVARRGSRKIDVRLPGKGNTNSPGARPVHPIISMIQWIRTSRLSIKNSLAARRGGAYTSPCGCRLVRAKVLSGLSPYRGTSLIRKRPTRRTGIGPWS